MSFFVKKILLVGSIGLTFLWNLPYMSAQHGSSDFDVWIVEFDEFCHFVDRGSSGRNVVDDEDGFVAEESEIWNQRKCIFQIF